MELVKLQPTTDPLILESEVIAKKFLADAMARTEGQHITSVAIVMLTDKGEVIDGWSATTWGRPYTMLGALEDLKSRYRENNIER